MNLRHKLKKIKSNISVILKLDVFYSRLSFSQEGEDILLDKLFAPDYVGFYVDVGAHHPYRYSNTNRLYKRGWRGINVDVDVSAIELFDKARPHDFNINIAVSTKTGKVNYYQFTESALNTISKRNYKRVITSGQSKFTEEIKVKTQSLAKILAKFAKGKAIDLLNVDVEGAEMEVLRSTFFDELHHLIPIGDNRTRNSHRHMVCYSRIFQIQNRPADQIKGIATGCSKILLV